MFESIPAPDRQNELKIRQAEAPGNYLLEGPAHQTVAAFSVNVPSEESDLTRVPVREIESLFGPAAVIPVDRKANIRDILKDHWSEPLELFPLLMVLLLVFLAVENLLSNKFYRRAIILRRPKRMGTASIMLLANTSVTVDPAWPWSLPVLGGSALGGVAILLAGLTVWTYLGVASWRRVGLVLALRLLALIVACVVILRPSLAFEDAADERPSRLFFLLDYSESMKITDDFNNESRWKNANRILATPIVKEALGKLTAAKTEITYYQGAEGLRPYDPASQPTGKATDMGTWLHEIGQRHGTESNLRGLILLSDGADNGSTFATLEQAAQLRGTCPIFPFGLGRPTTTSKSNDIELTDIRVEPDPIPVKGKIKVTGRVNAPGFENSSVNVSLWIQERGAKEAKLAGAERHVLKKTQGNEVVIFCDAPEAAGEIKVTLKIPPLDGEVSVLNNEISTYATVTKEGVSILWVEGRRRLESVFANRHALKNDRRFRTYFIELESDQKPGPEVADWFDLGKRHYDVIVIGDITAKRLAGGDPDVFRKISAMVKDKGTGLLMMGGYQTLGGSEDSDWEANGAPLTAILPVTVGRDHGQSAARVRMEPTKDGLDYLLRLDDLSNDAIWNKIFDPLEGFNNLGNVRKRKARQHDFRARRSGQRTHTCRPHGRHRSGSGLRRRYHLDGLAPHPGGAARLRALLEADDALSCPPGEYGRRGANRAGQAPDRRRQQSAPRLHSQGARQKRPGG